MKKTVWIIVIVFVLIASSVFGIYWLTNRKENTSRYTLLTTSVSPDGTYTLNAYRTEPGATTDFSIKVYLESGKKEKRIYDAYHEETVDIKWLDNERVCINGKTLELSEKETYDWRKQSYQ
ncbi:MAG: hypothetical protein IJJ41_05700 [Clostridia bacterium]|nr:hypothetical protein [Clostridia bacterium]MBR0415513.1 hypothetical protein [Clostridia bacterium]